MPRSDGGGGGSGSGLITDQDIPGYITLRYPTPYPLPLGLCHGWLVGGLDRARARVVPEVSLPKSLAIVPHKATPGCVALRLTSSAQPDAACESASTGELQSQQDEHEPDRRQRVPGVLPW